MCTTLPATIAQARDKFALACKEATTLEIVGNFAAAFNAVGVITLLREALTDEVLDKVFMPLMNTKIGFRTDRDGKPHGRDRKILPLYTRDVVRECLIDAVIIGLLPTGNQFNIISGTMYPTKEGYTALLKKLGVKYIIDIQQDRSQTPGVAELPCKISYEYNGDKNSFTVVATVKRDEYSSNDQIRGKAERRAKKALYEYITGSDFGEADENSSRPERPAIDIVAEEIATEANAAPAIGIEDVTTEPVQPQAAPAQAQPQAAAPTPAQPQPQAQAAPQPSTPNNPGF